MTVYGTTIYSVSFLCSFLLLYWIQNLYTHVQKYLHFKSPISVVAICKAIFHVICLNYILNLQVLHNKTLVSATSCCMGKKVNISFTEPLCILHNLYLPNGIYISNLNKQILYSVFRYLCNILYVMYYIYG